MIAAAWFNAKEPPMRHVIMIFLPLALTGCIAKTAVDIVTLPVKAASGAVDVLTTSQSEADENAAGRCASATSASAANSGAPNAKIASPIFRAAELLGPAGSGYSMIETVFSSV